MAAKLLYLCLLLCVGCDGAAVVERYRLAQEVPPEPLKAELNAHYEQYLKDFDAAKELVIHGVSVGDSFSDFIAKAKESGAINALGTVVTNDFEDYFVIVYDVGLEHHFILTLTVVGDRIVGVSKFRG